MPTKLFATDDDAEARRAEAQRVNGPDHEVVAAVLLGALVLVVAISSVIMWMTG